MKPNETNKVFYRLWYTDFGGAYVFKDFEDESEAIKEAKQHREAMLNYEGEDYTKLEKHLVSEMKF